MTSSEAILVLVGNDLPGRPSRVREPPRPPLVISSDWNSEPSSRGPKKLRRGAGLPGFGGHDVGNRLRQRTEDDRHDHVADAPTTVAGRRTAELTSDASGAFNVIGL